MAITRVGHGFQVAILKHATRNKTNGGIYNLNLLFKVIKGGTVFATTQFSIVDDAITIAEWGGPKVGLIGKSKSATRINDNLNEKVEEAKSLLQRLPESASKTPKQIIGAIQTHIRTQLTGKAIRGEKKFTQEHFKQLTVEKTIRQLSTNLSTSRKRMYQSVLKVLTSFYNGTTPPLPLITREELVAFKQFYFEKFKKHTKETQSTYLGMVAHIFNYASEREMISLSPIPKGFTPLVRSKDRIERIILNPYDTAAVYNIPDSSLRSKEVLAKYIFKLQLLTGMGYCDIASLKREHVLLNKEIIKKPRAKNGEIFTVPLTNDTKQVLQKILDLVGGNAILYFNIPLLRVINKQFKKLAAYAGIEAFTSYDLRHTFSVRYMDNGGRLEDLAVILGHVKIETTRIYGKISEQRLRQTTNLITA